MYLKEFEVRWNDLDANRHLANSSYINFMRQDLKAPIIYNRIKGTYQYETNCNINFIHKKI